MIEVVAAVSLPRLPRGYTSVVDETDDRVKRLLRAGYLVPTASDLPEAPPVTPAKRGAKKRGAS